MNLLHGLRDRTTARRTTSDQIAVVLDGATDREIERFIRGTNRRQWESERDVAATRLGVRI
jgi:hypothetical protein